MRPRSMLAHARELERQVPRGIEYVHGDAHDLRPLADEQFDGVVCYMALMDIPELEPTIRSVARILKPGGWFVAVITHPCYKSPAHGELIDHVEGTYRRISGRYFEEGPTAASPGGTSSRGWRTTERCRRTSTLSPPAGLQVVRLGRAHRRQGQDGRRQQACCTSVARLMPGRAVQRLAASSATAPSCRPPAARSAASAWKTGTARRSVSQDSLLHEVEPVAVRIAEGEHRRDAGPGDEFVGTTPPEPSARRGRLPRRCVANRMPVSTPAGVSDAG